MAHGYQTRGVRDWGGSIPSEECGRTGTLAHNPEARSSPTVIIAMDRTGQPSWVSYINFSIKYRLVFCTGDPKMFLGKIKKNRRSEGNMEGKGYSFQHLTTSQ